ncbi:MAG TPA: hypothetical protein PKE27_17385 [Povalibacter sp.]|uniref:hypothetical protein n=1 Tax=Povalibacter sp. TaxID=1962978 RepID=UPI002C684035|nr:hypothetical protein [Povalibacter sp.]HMN46355.1 hypothetical protein [Povalibacter sp.]
MNTKTASIVALLAVAAAPLAGHAGDLESAAAFDACIKAFSTQQIADHPVLKTRTNYSYASPTLAYWKPDSYTIEVRARGVRSGEVVATARCLVDGDNVVLIPATPKTVVTTKEL